MFSVSPAELLTIAVVVLVVFGPRRLPEIARTFGKALREMRRTADELKSGIEEEYGQALGPLDEARREIKASFDSLDPSSPPPSAAADPAAAPDHEENPG